MNEKKIFKKAFVLTAGLGTRLRPYTDTLPKPMVPLAGRPLLDYICDHLVRAGVEDVTVNLHHLPDPIRACLAKRHDLKFFFSYEEELLDTGGGVRKQIDTLGEDPFYVINGDAFWIDGRSPALPRLAAAFDERKMDILLLLEPVKRMKLTGAVGDYNLTPEGRAIRRPNRDGTHMFTGIRLVSPEIFRSTKIEKFSFLTLMDKCEAAGRLFALEHDGEWHHISTPADLESVNAHFKATPRTGL